MIDDSKRRERNLVHHHITARSALLNLIKHGGQSRDCTRRHLQICKDFSYKASAPTLTNFMTNVSCQTARFSLLPISDRCLEFPLNNQIRGKGGMEQFPWGQNSCCYPNWPHTWRPIVVSVQEQLHESCPDTGHRYDQWATSVLKQLGTSKIISICVNCPCITNKPGRSMCW